MRIQTATLIAALTTALGLAAGCAPKSQDTATPVDSREAESNRTAITAALNNLDRTTGTMGKQLEMEEAKHQGLFDTLPDGAKADPQYPLIEKQHAEIVAEYEEAQRLHKALQSFADGIMDAPSTPDTVKVTQEATKIQQEYAAIMTHYGRLQIEMMSIKSRHPN
ncbi:MAG: hypothetical protein AAF721_08500 [Myxococcota bacterium]